MTVRVILGRIVGRSRRRNPRPEELGSVTAEFAVALPAVTAVLALCLGAASTGVAQVKLEESARAAARRARLGSRDSCGRRTHRPGAERAGERGERGAW